MVLRKTGNVNGVTTLDDNDAAAAAAAVVAAGTGVVAAGDCCASTPSPLTVMISTFAAVALVAVALLVAPLVVAAALAVVTTLAVSRALVVLAMGTEAVVVPVPTDLRALSSTNMASSMALHERNRERGGGGGDIVGYGVS